MTMLEYLKQSFETFKNIGLVSSLNLKQELLLDGDNPVTRNLLLLAYNPFLQYNLKKIPIALEDCTGEDILEENYYRFIMLLNKLSKREITGNLAISEVSEFLKGCCEEEFTWYTRILNKDLAIGLALKGINKAFKKLIPVYDVLLADKIPAQDLNLDTPKAMKLLPDRIVTQYKIDGYRLNIHVFETGEVDIRTRNGKPVKGYNQLEKEAAEKLPRGYVYDGEIVAPELFEWISENMKKQESVIANRDLFSEVMSHAFSKEDNKQGVFNMFDMIPITEWNSRNCTMTLEQRTNLIRTKVQPLSLNTIVVVPTSRVYLKSNPEDLREIVDTFHKYIDIGWEGLMIKNWDSTYEFKRSKNLLKMKLMDTIDLMVVDIFEGSGKYSGVMGGVYVEYKGNTVGVGSGWSDFQREYYWNHKNEILGKTIEISYQAETKNKQGDYSLSFPVVKNIREDK